MIKKLINTDDIIELYNVGIPMQEIADRYSINISVIWHRLKDSGTKILTSKERSERGWLKRRISVDAPAVCNMFNSGQSVNSIANHFGISRSAITRTLRYNNIQPRSKSDAERLKWGRIKATQGGVNRQLGGAWKANIGAGEQAIADDLRSRGYSVTQQFAVDRYNLDIAVNRMPIAIEIEGAAPGTFASGRMAKRTKYLINNGWFVIFVRFKRPNRPIAPIFVVNQLVTLIKFASKNKTVFGQYGVILGDPKYRPAISYNLDGVTRIDSLLNGCNITSDLRTG